MGRDFLFSPCPNDIFLFWPWVAKWSDAPFYPDYTLLDIAELNHRAKDGRAELLKLSVATYLEVQHLYEILPVGAAFAAEEGPKLVASASVPLGELPTSVLVPGLNTTAAFVMRRLFPGVTLVPAHFREIPRLLREQTSKAPHFGVLINESRGNLLHLGLVEVCDLGKLWLEETGHKLPLGCLALRRGSPLAAQDIVDAVLKSHETSRANPAQIEQAMLAQSLEKDPQVCWDHVHRYVTEDSLGRSPEAEAALDYIRGLTSLSNVG